MCVLVRVELCRWDRRDPQLHDQEPAELEVARAVDDVRWEGVGFGECDPGEVREDEVAALGNGILQGT